MSKWVYNGVEFKVGDKVKIIQKVEAHAKDGMGQDKEWMNCWNPEMTPLIQKKDKITSITDQGVGFEELGFFWPLSSLELLPKTPCEKLDKKIAKAAALEEKLKSLNNEIAKLKGSLHD
jgi:hypothetical protein